jgi:hypothetical protein
MWRWRQRSLPGRTRGPGSWNGTGGPDAYHGYGRGYAADSVPDRLGDRMVGIRPERTRLPAERPGCRAVRLPRAGADKCAAAAGSDQPDPDLVEVEEIADGQGAGRSYESLVAGFQPSHALTRFTGSQFALNLYLTPLGVYRILGIPGSALAWGVHDLEDVAPNLASLPDRLASLRTWSERFAVVDEALARMADRGPEQDPLVDWVWHPAAGVGRSSASFGSGREIGMEPPPRHLTLPRPDRRHAQSGGQRHQV